MTKLKRNYSQKTLKILFARSGNRCAYPECENPVIVSSTDVSDARVLNQICHIYALNENGPRGKAWLTEEELNAPDNLVLFCPTHHVIIDGQYETYPADKLKEWKQKHESEIEKRISVNSASVQPDVLSHSYFPTALIDQEIKKEVDIIRKSRFFVEFDQVRASLALARRLAEGELSGGTDAVKSQALAWCVRFLSTTEQLDKAEEYLKIAKVLGTCSEIDIADAFISSQKGEKNKALNILTHIDSSISRSAALMVVAHHDGLQGSIDWLKTAGIDARNLDSDGKFFLLKSQFELANWEATLECLEVLNDDDQRNTPVLHHMMARVHLLSTVPNELRTTVFNQPLLNKAADFPLASDAVAIKARRAAHYHFIKAAEVAQQLNCPHAAIIEDEYALWLELRDPDEFDKGRQRLEAKLRDPKSVLHFVHFGLQFKIKLDLEAIEREIDRHIALNGGITYDTAVARFDLAFTQQTPRNVANYIAQHCDELAQYFDKKSIQLLQIEMLSRAGLPERANECLDTLVEEGLSVAEESRFRGIIAEAEGTDPVEARKEQFKKTDSLGDLMSLVNELEIRCEWDNLCEYGEILFARTHSLHDAERLANALSNTHKNELLIEFLTANPTFLAQSKNLRMLHCWSLYYEGALLEARSELAKLSDDRDNPSYRALQINLGITLGDWNSLSALVANECSEKDKKSTQDLISIAKLALHVGLPHHAKELIIAAADKGHDDANVLATAYFLASNAGWEDDAKVCQWLHQAVALSGSDGPLQKMSLQDILDRKPEWDRRESETWQLLSRGDIPIFLAAQSLNKSLVDLTLFPALTNLSKNDPRQRRAIPAYSGKRQPSLLNTDGTVGIDATTLLTLGFLDLLDETLDAFDTVYVPHSTLAWLFEEKQKIAFHQPSRIRGAHQVRDLLATGVLKELVPSTAPDSELSAQVGDELALLIAEAEQVRENDDTQRIVVRSSPVYRIASLMEEEADLTVHAVVLSSCQSIVDKLRQKGQMTTQEEKKARAYLQLHEKPWSNQAEIADGAILYLDNLAITYFLHLGILAKLQAAGFRPMILPKQVSEINELISYESILCKVNDTIERIRSTVNLRIESGQVKVGRRTHADQPVERSISEHPTFSVIDLAKHCDAIIIDDRYLNQYENCTQTPIFSTLDLLDALVSIGSKTPEDRLEYLTRLRHAGYFLMPVSDDELADHLNASMVKDNKVIETVELKAIRENILCVRMSTWLQLPQEAPWLERLFKVLIRVLKGLWKTDADLAGVRARSDWIIGQIDVRGWAHRFGNENGDNIVKIGRGVYILMLLTPPEEAPWEIKNEYWRWIENRVLVPIKEQYPDLYSRIVSWQKRQLAEMVDTTLTEWESEMTNSPYVRSALAHEALKFVPPLIRKTLFEEPSFGKEYSFRTNAILSFGDSDVSVQCSDLFKAVRQILSDALVKEVTDTDGQKWELKNISGEGQLPSLELSRSEQRFILPDFITALSPDQTTRLRYLDKAAADVNLPSSAQDTWRNVLTERALEDDEVDVFHSEFCDTPVEKARAIRSEMVGGQISKTSLVPLSRRYFERLVGVYDGSTSIRNYAAGSGRALFEQLSTWRSSDGFLFGLFLSSHSSMTAEINVDQLGNKDLVHALDFLDKYGDRTSQLGAIEVGLRILPSGPEIEPILIRLIKQIRDDNVDGQASGFKLFSALFVFIDGELSRTQLLSTEPPFYRRLAALSQAALIHRQLVNSVNIDPFCEWTFSNCGRQYYLQSLADMRLEPRWNPDLAVASQMKAEFFGRIMIAAKNYEQNIKDSELFDLVLSTQPGSLQSRSDFFQSQGDFFYPYLPGPLEGTEESQNILPTEIAEMIKIQLDAEEIGTSSFITLVNSALIFRIGANQAELAAKALKLGSYRLASVEDRSQLLAILNGLATVAAVARSRTLANELRILVRRYRGDAEYALSVEEVMRIYLVAAASCADLDGWRELVGDWLTELAFSNLKGDDSKVLYSHLQHLCHVVPELWVSCGRAEAALMAYNTN